MASSSGLFLTESDIPGAALAGRKPEELSKDQLRFWLSCRGYKAKKSLSKAELCKRVHEYIQSGKDKDIVDPDPEAIYTQRKQQRQPATSTSDNNEPPRIRVKFPDKGWGISLEKMPLFSRAEMNRHIENSGKQIANKSNNTVTTGLRKAKRFLDDEYLEDIQCAFDQKYFYIKSKCCHSYRKNDPSHDLKVALCVISGDVQSAYCSCVAGAVGYCNHVLALMFKLCKFSLYNCRKTTDKIQDDDDRIACTSKLQQWHKKGGGANIDPSPVMEVHVNKTKLDEARSRPGVRPLVYDARAKKTHSEEGEKRLKEELFKIDPNMGLAQLFQEPQQQQNTTETRFGKCKVGSYLSYQVSVTESNFQAYADISAIQRAIPLNQDLVYPRFPLAHLCEDDIVLPDIGEDGKKFIDRLSVDELDINVIEKETQEQANCEKWKEERKYRFTASKFHLISKRQRNHDTFANSLMNPGEVQSRYLQHGRTYEPVALQEYEKFMYLRRTPVKVLSSGFVVSKTCPIIGASPDAKVIDPGCIDKFGLAEVKCPCKMYNVTPLEASQDSTFCMSKISDSECKLKEDHPYYYQVQGQMGVTGASWCDFIVYTKKGLYVQRIAFDPQFWEELRTKLTRYYFEHFLHYALLEHKDDTVQ